MASPLPASLTRVRQYVASGELRRFGRYASVSVFSTVLSITLLYLFFRVVKVGSAALSNILATGIVTVPSYYLNRAWAWGKTGKSHLWKEVVPFWVIAFGSLVLSTGAVALAAHEAHLISQSKHFQTALVLFANFVTYGILWVAKFTLFNKVLFKIRHVPAEGRELADVAYADVDDPAVAEIAPVEVP